MVLLILVRFVSQQVELSQVRAPFFVHDTAKKPDRGVGSGLDAAVTRRSLVGAEAVAAEAPGVLRRYQVTVTTAPAEAGTPRVWVPALRVSVRLVVVLL